MSYGRPDNSWYQFYIDQFLKTKRGLSVNCLWFVYIDCPVKAGLGFIADSAKNLSESVNYSTQTIYKEALKYFTVGLSNNAAGIGARPFFLANTVEVPEDSITSTTLNTVVQGGSAAISPKTVSGVRNGTGNFSTQLYLNDFSFSNTILRPWVRAISLYGMKFQCLRTQMRCVQYTRQFRDGQWQPTLQLVYFGVFPLSAPAYSLNYNGADITKSVNVQWGYDDYKIALGDIDYDSNGDTGWGFDKVDAANKVDETWRYIPIKRGDTLANKDTPVGYGAVGQKFDYQKSKPINVEKKPPLGPNDTNPHDTLNQYGDEFEHFITSKEDIFHGDETLMDLFSDADSFGESYGDLFQFITPRTSGPEVYETKYGNYVIDTISRPRPKYDDMVVYRDDTKLVWRGEVSDIYTIKRNITNTYGKNDTPARYSDKFDTVVTKKKKTTKGTETLRVLFSSSDTPGTSYSDSFQFTTPRTDDIKIEESENGNYIVDSVFHKLPKSDDTPVMYAYWNDYLAPRRGPVYRRSDYAEDTPSDITMLGSKIMARLADGVRAMIGFIIGITDTPTFTMPYIIGPAPQNDTANGRFFSLIGDSDDNDTPNGSVEMSNVMIDRNDASTGRGTYLNGDVNMDDVPIGSISARTVPIDASDTPVGKSATIIGDVDKNDTPTGGFAHVIGDVDPNDTPNGSSRYLGGSTNQNDTPIGDAPYINIGAIADDEPKGMANHIENTVEENDTPKGVVKHIEAPKPENDTPDGSSRHNDVATSDQDTPNWSVPFIQRAAADPQERVDMIEREVPQEDTPSFR